MRECKEKKTASIGSFSDYIPFKPLTKSDDESWVAPPPAASVLNSKVNSATVSCSCIQVNRCSSASLPLGDVWRQNKLTNNHMSSDSLPWIYVTSCIHSCSEVICQTEGCEQNTITQGENYASVIWLFSEEAKMPHTPAIIQACLIPLSNTAYSFKNRNADNLFIFNWVFTALL